MARPERGFTLVELLVVIAIIAVLSSILFFSISAIKDSQNMTTAAQNIQDVLEQARTLAMAGNTYTWVGFFEESPLNPGTTGTGQVVISIVESANGTELYTLANPVTQLPSASLIQAVALMKMSNLHLEVLPNPFSATAATRPSVASANYQVGGASFANGTTFPYPLTGTAQYTFSNIIQFNPQGDATRIADVPTQVIEIGLCPAHENVAVTASTDVAAVQVAGIGGHATLYRP